MRDHPEEAFTGGALRVVVRVEGLNLEKLLRMANEEGIRLSYVRRMSPRALRVCVAFQQKAAFFALCDRIGFGARETGSGLLVRLSRFFRRRPLLPAGAVLAVLLVWLSSQMILAVSIAGAGENIAEVRRVLDREGIRAGRLKAAVSLDALREELVLSLPGLSFAGVRYVGSTMLVDCQRAREGEMVQLGGAGVDVVAAQDGVITRIYASSGTPQVVPGQAVRRGQVLIGGQERTQKGETRSVTAQGEVYARVWAKGEARAALRERRTVETGQTRTRVTLRSPWHARVVRSAVPFASQDVSREIQPVVGLFLPLWREIETYAETMRFDDRRDTGDALSAAQGAAEEIAKKQCPPDALILDKNVDYSMIDNEFVYAVVILEYEAAIAARGVQ